MPSSDITYNTRTGESFSGILTQPEGEGDLPGIVLVTAIFGIDDEMIELAEAYAADGYLVSVPDYFWRQTPGPTADREVAFARMKNYDRKQGIDDIEDVITDLRSHPLCNGKIAVLGFCFGGWIAHVSAARFGINAAGCYHGTQIGNYLDETPNISCPVSFHFGSEDPAVPMDEVNQIQNAYKDLVNAEIVVHRGVGHNFSMPYKPGYNVDVANSSREAVLNCFRQM